MRKKTTEEFVLDSKKIHGDKYDYSKVDYKGNKTNVCIICPVHGEFWQRPSHHLSGCGCKSCQYEKLHDEKFKTYDDFKSEASLKHNWRYSYEDKNDKYVNLRSLVNVFCCKHGWFVQEANSHLQGHGCKKCHDDKMKKILSSNTKEFIEKAKIVHGDKYDYSKVEYSKSNVPVCIICSKHGEFWQSPNNHLNGRNCPECSVSRMEEITEKFLKDRGIEFIRECSSKSLSFLKKYRLDFYIPVCNTAIECQGEQHYKPVNYFGGEDGFIYRCKCDSEKKKLCEENKVKIEYIRFDEDIHKRLEEIFG